MFNTVQEFLPKKALKEQEGGETPSLMCEVYTLLCCQHCSV